MAMKKMLLSCIVICAAISMAGCSMGELLSQFLTEEEQPSPSSTIENPRVYMDEIRGSIQDFSGSQLTILSEGQLYAFDVSQATLECQNGIISGDEVSLIYEGQLSGTDTSSVKVLKVVDEINKKSTLEDRTAHGKILNLTPNTITIQAKSGKKATYPITGTEQYYRNGIKEGLWVYLHFKGTFPSSQPDNPDILNASLLKVTSISDSDPFKAPSPTPTPSPSEQEQEEDEKQLEAVIQDLSLNMLSILPAGAEETISIDLSSLPVYLNGGAAPGSYVTITYTGEFDGTSTEEMTVTSVTSKDSSAISAQHISFTVSGTIIGTTANTCTIQTPDGALITCMTQGAPNSSSGGMLSGTSIKVTFHPANSRVSNIYTALKIEDA